jgi:polo-like kinase 1
LAPEVLDSQFGHSYEVDVWSFGVILYTMLAGKPPFESDAVKKTYKRIGNCDYEWPTKVTLSESAKDVISKILVKLP